MTIENCEINLINIFNHPDNIVFIDVMRVTNSYISSQIVNYLITMYNGTILNSIFKDNYNITIPFVKITKIV